MKVLLVLNNIVVPCHMVSHDNYNSTAQEIAKCKSSVLLSAFTGMNSVKLPAIHEDPCLTDGEAETQLPLAALCLPF